MRNQYQKNRRGKRPRERSEYDHKVLDIARVTRVTKGGKRFSFRAAVVAGDGKGKIGLGISQGKDVAQAVQKSVNRAIKSLSKVNIYNGTIPHDILYKYKSAVVLLRQARSGRGIKAGGPVRAIAQLVGLKNLTGKLISRTNNKINIARAAIGALKKLKVKNERGETTGQGRAHPLTDENSKPKLKSKTEAQSSSSIS